MRARHVLRCLAQPALFDAAGAPVRFKTRKHFALLVYLAMGRRTAHRRDRLADLLWDTVSAAEGRHSLATALTTLRTKLGPDALECTRETVRLVHTGLELDVDRLLAGDVLPTDDRPPLEVAAFLDDFELPGAVEFMLWKDQEQARLLPLLRTALIQLMDLRRRRGEFREIERLADRMLRLDHLSEEAIRAKIEARAFDGDRVGALRIFETWQAQLQEELGAQPSVLLEGMAIRLRRRGWEREASSPISTIRTDQWKDRPFIGRTAEYRTLYEAWERARDGTPTHLLVTGDSGVGKTTLVARLTTAARLETAAAARVQCYEIDRDLPYGTLGTLIGGLVEHPGASATDPQALAVLATAFPSVRARFSALPEASLGEGDTVRLRLAEALLDLLGAMTGEQPVILIVDDLHYCDDASLSVLHLVCRRLAPIAVQMIFIARASEIRGGSNAERLIRDLGRLGFTTVEVPPLTDAEAGEMIDALVSQQGAALQSTNRRALVRAASGYPMALELLAQEWAAAPERCAAVSLRDMSPELDSAAPSATYRILTEQIVASLDDTTRTVLHLAAVVGNRLNDLELYHLLDLSLGATMAGLSRLTALRLLRDGEHGLEFINDLVRANVYLQVPSTLRKALHAKVAKYLLDRHRDDADSSLEIAWHCIRSGRLGGVVPYLVRGGRRALEQGALSEAERALTSALVNLSTCDREEVEILLVEIRIELALWTEAARLLYERIARRKSSVPQNTTLEEVLLVHCRERMGALYSATLDESIQTLEDGFVSGIPAAISWAMVTIALVANHLRDTALAAAFVARSDEIDTSGWSRLDITRFREGRARLEFNARMTDRAMLTLEALADDLTQSAGQSMQLAHVLSGLGAVYGRRQEYSNAIDAQERSFRIADRLGNDNIAGGTAANLAFCYSRVHATKEQVFAAEAALQRINKVERPFAWIQARHALALGHARSGNVQGALAEIAELKDDTHLQPWARQARHLLLAGLYEEMGNQREALQQARLGTSGEFHELMTMDCAGMFARSIVRQTRPETLEEDRRRLRALLIDLESLDVSDRMEVLEAAGALDVWTACGSPSVNSPIEPPK